MNSTSTGTSKNRKGKMTNGHLHGESMCEETNGITGDSDQLDEWDEQAANYSISNKLLNGTQEKMDYSDLFTYMLKLFRQSKYFETSNRILHSSI
jgi:hypothetical protein